MARYLVNKNCYNELLCGKKVKQYIPAAVEITLDVDTEEEVILRITNANSFWRICKGDKIVASSHDFFIGLSKEAGDYPDICPPSLNRQAQKDIETDINTRADAEYYYEKLNEHVDTIDNLIRTIVENNTIKHVTVDGDLHLTFEDGTRIDVFMAFGDTAIGYEPFSLECGSEKYS